VGEVDEHDEDDEDCEGEQRGVDGGNGGVFSAATTAFQLILHKLGWWRKF